MAKDADSRKSKVGSSRPKLCKAAMPKTIRAPILAISDCNWSGIIVYQPGTCSMRNGFSKLATPNVVRSNRPRPSKIRISKRGRQ